MDGFYCDEVDSELDGFRKTKAENLRSYMNVKKSLHLYQGSGEDEHLDSQQWPKQSGTLVLPYS